jgi:hypothetical protein
LVADLSRVPTGTSATVALPPQLTPPAPEAFWLQLPNATISGDILRLAGGTTFLGSSTLPDAMYIRDDYVQLWAEIQRLFSSGLSRIVISGTPGIGKSWFGFFVAFKLLSGSEPPAIVWESRRRSSRTLIRGAHVMQGNLDAFVCELNDSRTMYLVDEPVPPGAVEVEARTLVFSSPARENYKYTLKAPASTIRYLPVWSWDEIESCRQKLYPEDPIRTPHAVQEAYSRWGGIPRYVLEKVGDAAAQLLLEQALAVTKLDALLRSVGEVDTLPDAGHRIVHMVTSAPYVETAVEFGSDYITARATANLLSRQRAELSYFVSREDDPLSKEFAKMRDDCFEALAHETLAAGGAFRTRLLTSAGCEEKSRLRSLPKATLRRFSGNTPADLVALHDFCAGDYCQPRVSHFPVLDALIMPDILLQMTVSSQHAVDEAKLAHILQVLSLQTAELLFVVPPDKYDDLKPHNFKDASLQQRITQKALCVSFDVVL